MSYLKNKKDIGKIISDIASALPNSPDYRIWSIDGDEILCETEQIAETLADLFDSMYGGPTVNTGYYDPIDDERYGETDDRTGFYYVTVN